MEFSGKFFKIYYNIKYKIWITPEMIERFPFYNSISGVCQLFSGQELENSRSCQGNIAEGALSLCCILFLEK